MTIERPLLNYFGGKWRIAEWVIQHFPEHGTYCEVFGGGLSVFMRKKPCKLEIVNDREDRVVNVYRQVRDNSKELERLIQATPYSRTEYRFCQNKSDEPIEDARRTICALAFGVGHSLVEKTTGLRNSKKSGTSPPKSFRNYAETFSQFHERMKGALIENLDWRDCLRKYDDAGTLFYLDPPYVHSTRKEPRGYTYEMKDNDHLELIEAVKKLKGKVVLSGYANPLYESLGWKTVTCEAGTQNSGKAVETLWLCPKTEAEQKQMSFL